MGIILGYLDGPWVITRVLIHSRGTQESQRYDGDRSRGSRGVIAGVGSGAKECGQPLGAGKGEGSVLL